MRIAALTLFPAYTARFALQPTQNRRDVQTAIQHRQTPYSQKEQPKTAFLRQVSPAPSATMVRNRRKNAQKCPRIEANARGRTKYHRRCLKAHKRKETGKNRHMRSRRQNRSTAKQRNMPENRPYLTQERHKHPLTCKLPQDTKQSILGKKNRQSGVIPPCAKQSHRRYRFSRKRMTI